VASFWIAFVCLGSEQYAEPLGPTDKTHSVLVCLQMSGETQRLCPTGHPPARPEHLEFPSLGYHGCGLVAAQKGMARVGGELEALEGLAEDTVREAVELGLTCAKNSGSRQFPTLNRKACGEGMSPMDAPLVAEGRAQAGGGAVMMFKLRSQTGRGAMTQYELV